MKKEFLRIIIYDDKTMVAFKNGIQLKKIAGIELKTNDFSIPVVVIREYIDFNNKE